MRSTLQHDFNDRLIRGGYAVHHIFPGIARRKKCEEYGFLVAITPIEHYLVHTHPNTGLDLKLKQEAQRIFEKSDTRENFIKTFMRSYL